ncbi:hypothetical protein pb186bvf_020550 [Paramecium bursaria]
MMIFKTSLRLAYRNTMFIQPMYNFAKITKKEAEKQQKISEKEKLNLPKTIDFQPFEKKFNELKSSITQQLQKIQIGKLTVDQVENFKLTISGEKLKLNSVAQISQKASGLIVTVYEEGMITDVMKGLENSDLNVVIKRQDKSLILNPAAGQTKESRTQAVNQLKKQIEEAKLNYRDVRHECLEHIKPYKKVAPEDSIRKAEKQIQELYEKQISNLEQLHKQKEKELLNN